MKLLVFTFLVTLSTAYAVWINNLPCNCRLGNLKRVVNGQIAEAHSIPWMVSLGDKENNHICGATIINQNWILTAAHCTEGMKPESLTVRVGVQDILKLYVENVYKVKTIAQANFKKPGDYGDFALVELERPIKFVPGEIEPGCLNFKDDNFEGDLLSAGWGVTERPWKKLKDADGLLNHPPTRNNYELKYYFSTQTIDECKSHDICVEAKNDEDSICHGDSGGPLMQTKNGKTSIIGMASFVNSSLEGSKLYFCVGHASYSRLKLYKNTVKEFVGQYCSI